MKFQPFAFWTTALICGILIQEKFRFAVDLLWSGFIINICLLLLSYFFYRLRNVFIFLGLLLLVFTGALRFISHNQQVEPLTTISNEKQAIKFQVKQKLKSSAKFNKYIGVTVASKNSNLLNKRVLMYVRKSQTLLHRDDKFWTYTSINEIPGAKNPHQFDYRNYMLRKKVGFQFFTDTIVEIQHPEQFNLNHINSLWKEEIKQKLEAQGFSQESRIFISSLALGDRSDLSADYQEKLSSAGVMHLFAISGLHVGIVFAFLMLLLYPALYVQYGKNIRIITALLVIWFYAWFVGFTPSVTRAAFMISVYYSTILLRRPTNIFHTLALSGFVLLLVNPNQLFDVGFQLSYSAVFFIAWLFPAVRKYLPFHRKPWRNYPYDLLTVTTVAQMGVMPISIYYFNTFSGVFLLGNMVLLPFAGILIVISVLACFLISFGIMPGILVNFLNTSFRFIFNYLDKITGFESLIFKGISWNIFQVLLLLVMLVGLRWVLQKFRIYKFLPVFLIFILFQLTRIYDELKFSTKRELIVFHEYKGSMIGIREGKKLDVFMQTEDSLKSINFTIRPYAIHEKISELKVHKLQDSCTGKIFIKKGNLIKFNGELFGIVTSESDTIPPIENLIVRRINSSVIFPDQVINIIADGSNYPNVIAQLRKDSVQLYNTAEKGAFLKTIE